MIRKFKMAIGALPAPVRHAVLAAFSVAVAAVWEAWTTGDVTDPSGLAVVAAAAVIGWATPLIQSWGRGRVTEP